ncbi:Hsp20/alpha crystallin family protein [Oscillochloris sp. ZM17-4]|uniref:Hsp20/alpha crystallin family protein n=1 Tax=Oscillochloris sp. ZM17-4 TaxID=2866714 RepID=UPI001C734060|nr:Hsp20/alpha crystallin family protein [Oscillochloris sp. ZM17-4]MBX0326452.1 Hsp20/alpha crystallin family protein [Oscillochloris sp. ZM17-4]
MATITRWDPFQDAMSLREAMNQLFEESLVPGVATARNGQGFTPVLDLSETPDAYEIEVAVPGMKAEDLKLTFENSVLTISGEVKQDEEKKGRNYHRVERRYGKFSRSITFPSTVKGDAIVAKLEHGVLNLTLPKAEEVKPRQISINVQ